MPKYEVFIRVVGHETYEVEADSEEEAIEKAISGEGECTATDTHTERGGDHEAVLLDN